MINFPVIYYSPDSIRSLIVLSLPIHDIHLHSLEHSPEIIKDNKIQGDPVPSYTDFMIWAIFANHTELAKAIWRQSDFPIHSALIACQLYPILFYGSIPPLMTTGFI